MAAETYPEFIANIMKTLEKSGYPGKRVALPMERMYAVAYEKQLNFNKALTMLEEQGVAHEKTTEKVIFFPKPAEQPSPSPQDIMAQASEMLKGMPPEQLRKLEEMYRGMSDDQRHEVMKKAKDMGLL